MNQDRSNQPNDSDASLRIVNGKSKDLEPADQKLMDSLKKQIPEASSETTVTSLDSLKKRK